MMIITNFNEQTANSGATEIIAGFYVMPKYSLNLEQFYENGKMIKPTFIYQIASELLQSFEIIHSCGRTFNDLKPPNVMVGKNEMGNDGAVLIDFGFVQKFRDNKGVHNAKDIERKNFQGNMMFASIDQMEFKETSRRDDLASLAYMILYLMND